MKTSDGLILKKSEYSETSLIITVLTYDSGRQSGIIKGARKSGRTSYPLVDLFREVRIIYRSPSKGELLGIRDIDVLRIHDAIALDPYNFRVANWLCRFTLKNTRGGIAVPKMYQALKTAFHRLNSRSTVGCVPIIMPFCIVALADNGLLPSFFSDPNSQPGFEKMIDFALNADRPLPGYSVSEWKELADWTQQFIVNYTEFDLPGGGLLRM